MTFWRRIGTAAAAVLAMAAVGAAAQAQDKADAKESKGPVVYSPEVNMCRAACGDAWVKARTCRDDAAVCLSRADQSYKQCLPDCKDGKAPLSNAFAWFAAQRPPAPATPIRPVVAPPAEPAPVDKGPDSTAAVPWVDARTQWILTANQAAAPLPYTFMVPSSAFAYAGQTRPIRPFILQSPSLLKVELVVVEGRVGVALITPDGSALASKEAALKPSPTVQSVYFEVGPQTPPVALVVRNYDAEGVPGVATVRAVTFARVTVLPPGEPARLGALK